MHFYSVSKHQNHSQLLACLLKPRVQIQSCLQAGMSLENQTCPAILNCPPTTGIGRKLRFHVALSVSHGLLSISIRLPDGTRIPFSVRRSARAYFCYALPTLPVPLNIDVLYGIGTLSHVDNSPATVQVLPAPFISSVTPLLDTRLFHFYDISKTPVPDPPKVPNLSTLPRASRTHEVTSNPQRKRRRNRAQRSRASRSPIIFQPAAQVAPHLSNPELPWEDVYQAGFITYRDPRSLAHLFRRRMLDHLLRSQSVSAYVLLLERMVIPGPLQLDTADSIYVLTQLGESASPISPAITACLHRVTGHALRTNNIALAVGAQACADRLALSTAVIL